MSNLKIEFYFKSILAICLISLSSAYFIEYVLGYQPCNLCLIERIPYWLGIVLIMAIFIFKKSEKILSLMLIFVFIFSLSISVYHFGIEQGFFEESAVCRIQNATEIISKEEILKQLKEKAVSCKDVTFRILGFSLTTINIVINLFILILLTKNFTNYEKIKY